MDETTGFWTVALGAATASGTWEGFCVSELRRTAELHVDGALTVKDDHPTSRDYALVLSHPSLGRDRILVAGKSGTVEFGHDHVELLALAEKVAGNATGEDALPALWLTDLSTGARSERCALPRAPRSARPEGT
jgi:hypothetical protein